MRADSLGKVPVHWKIVKAGRKTRDWSEFGWPHRHQMDMSLKQETLKLMSRGNLVIFSRGSEGLDELTWWQTAIAAESRLSGSSESRFYSCWLLNGWMDETVQQRKWATPWTAIHFTVWLILFRTGLIHCSPWLHPIYFLQHVSQAAVICVCICFTQTFEHLSLAV